MIKPIQKSILFTKPRPLPKGLIFNPSDSDLYRLIETKTGKLIGEMNAFALRDRFCQYYDLKDNKSMMYISSFKIEPLEQNKGWGKYFIDFIKKESYRHNCNGRIYLIAHNEEKPPHAFYRKQGFATVDEDINRELDECIEYGIRPSGWRAMEMYLPENSEEIVSRSEICSKELKKKTGLWNYLKSLISPKL